MQPQRQVAINDDEPISAIGLFAVVYAVMAVLMTPLWMAAAHLAFEQSRTILAKALYLIVGAGFLVAMKFVGLERQYEVIFGVIAIAVNAFVYGVVVWFFVMARRMVRS